MGTNKHVLVTGATGFLGQHLVRFLAERPGLTVWGVSRGGGQVGGVRVEPVELSSCEEVATWHHGKPIFDAVFHLAAVVPTSFNSTETEASFLANVLMTQNVLSLAIREGATFIYASSTSVYDVNGRNTRLTEDMLPRPDNLYSLAKYVGEGLCEVAHIRHGLAATALRISAPYGPQQTVRTVLNTFLRAALQSQELTLYGTGERMQDFTYVGDIVQAFWLAYERGCGVYNIASGRPVTMRELAETVLAVVPGTKSQIIFPGQPDPQASYRGVFGIEKAKRELGYAPRTTLAEGLRACLSAMLEGER